MSAPKKSWLSPILNSNHFEHHNIYKLPFQDLERIIYATYQPSGLIYGYARESDLIDKQMKTDEAHKVKVLLLGAFVSFEKSYFGSENTETLIEELTFFYQYIYPDITSSKEKKPPLEQILDRRMDLKKAWYKSFWTSFFHNCLVFLDFIFYLKWKTEHLSIEQIQDVKTAMKVLILKTIAIVSHADGTIKEEEKKLYKHFLSSAHLPVNLEQECEAFFNTPQSLNDINFEVANSWILKKYILELASLTAWSDGLLDDVEQVQLKKLQQKLHLSDEDFEESLLAAESFILQNRARLHYLKENSQYKEASGIVIRRTKMVMNKFKAKIGQEINESKELVALLNKSRSEQLSKEEKEKVRTQLIDILKTIPIFVIIALPGSFLTLPVLLKILPKGVMPSAFQE